MHIASQNGHLDVIRLLLDSGIPVDIRNGDPSTPLALASSEGKVEVGHFLIEREADVNARDKDGWTPLHFASRYGQLDAVRLVPDRGVDANGGVNGHIGTVKLLLECGADAHAMNNEGQTPLELSLQRGYPEITDLLRKHGAGRTT